MITKKNILKNVLLGFLMLLIPWSISVNAAEEEIVTGELVDLQSLWGESDEEISLLSLENGMVDLKPGNHERWIDRIELPDVLQQGGRDSVGSRYADLRSPGG